MAATALIKFSQGASVGPDGEALKGVTGEEVTVENSDNADVFSWQIDLVYSDPTSSVTPATPFAFDDNDNTPIATFTPDVSGSYRFVLKVWNVVNRLSAPTSTDIRIFNVPEATGLVVPAPQLWPKPLPTPQSSAVGNRPSEYNFGGQPDGWAGSGSGDGLLNDSIRQIVRLQLGETPLSSERWADKGTEVPSTYRTGFIGAPHDEAADAVSGVPTLIHLARGAYAAIAAGVNLTLIGPARSLINQGPHATLTGGVSTPGLSLILQDVASEGLIECAGLDAQGVVVNSANIEATGGLYFNSCRFIGSVTVESDTDAPLVSIDASNCYLGTAALTTPGTVIRLRDCEASSGFSVTFTGDPGQLQVDAYTAQRLIDAGFSEPTNGSIVIVAQTPPSATSLFLTHYVDNQTSVLASYQNGSATSPFADLQDALDSLATALLASGGLYGVICLSPSPTPYGDVDLAGWEGTFLTLQGLGNRPDPGRYNPLNDYAGYLPSTPSAIVGGISNVGLMALSLTNLNVDSVSMAEGLPGTDPRPMLRLEDVTLATIEAVEDTDRPDVVCYGTIQQPNTGAWVVNTISTQSGWMARVDDPASESTDSGALRSYAFNGSLDWLTRANLNNALLANAGSTAGDLFLVDSTVYTGLTVGGVVRAYRVNAPDAEGFAGVSCDALYLDECFLGDCVAASYVELRNRSQVTSIDCGGDVLLLDSFAGITSGVNVRAFRSEFVLSETPSTDAVTCTRFYGEDLHGFSDTILHIVSPLDGNSGDGTPVKIRRTSNLKIWVESSGTSGPKVDLDLYSYRSCNAEDSIILTGVEEDPGTFELSAAEVSVAYTVAVGGETLGGGSPTAAAPTETVFDVADTAHLVDLPPTLNAGDLVLIFFSIASDSITVTTPTEVTLIDQSSITGLRLGLYYFISNGTEGGNTIDFVTSSAVQGVAQAYRVETWDGGVDFIAGTESVTGVDANPDPPAVSPTWTRDSLFFAIEANANFATTILSYPVSYTGGVGTSNTTGTGVTLGSAQRALASSYPEVTLAERAYVLVEIPAIATGVLEYVDVNVAETALEGVVPGVPITVNYHGKSDGVRVITGTDIAAAGAGAGALLNARVVRKNRVRLALVGDIEAGDYQFSLSIG